MASFTKAQVQQIAALVAAALAAAKAAPAPKAAKVKAAAPAHLANPYVVGRVYVTVLDTPANGVVPESKIRAGAKGARCVLTSSNRLSWIDNASGEEIATQQPLAEEVEFWRSTLPVVRKAKRTR